MRAFNRSYTQRIGVLAESYLDTGRALGPSRLLFEVGADGARVGDLRRRLGLDSGYLSRLLRQLEHEELITVAVDPADRRQRFVRLSAAGRREWRRLDRRSEHVARRLVDPLSPRHRAELAAALTTAERLLRAATVAFDIVDPRSARRRGGARALLRRARRPVPRRVRSCRRRRRRRRGHGPATTARSCCCAATARPSAAAALQPIDDRTAEIKRMWIDPAWRGLGLGPRLLTELEASPPISATDASCSTPTRRCSRPSRCMNGAGYDPIARYNDNPYAHHWFAKDL